VGVQKHQLPLGITPSGKHSLRRGKSGNACLKMWAGFGGKTLFS